MKRTLIILIITGLSMILLGIISYEYIETKCEEIDKNTDFWVRNCDYESGIHYAIYCKGGVTFDVSRCHNELKQDDVIQIYGMDNEELDILYDLIKADMVEKVEE